MRRTYKVFFKIIAAGPWPCCAEAGRSWKDRSRLKGALRSQASGEGEQDRVPSSKETQHLNAVEKNAKKGKNLLNARGGKKKNQKEPDDRSGTGSGGHWAIATGQPFG